jgi:RND family efflux transporter MFP subunit
VNKLQTIVAPLVVIGLGIGTYALLHVAKPEPEKKTQPPRALSVFVESVQRNDVALSVNTQGTVRPRTEIDIISQVGGRIIAVSPEFTEGGIVEPNVPLITIESTEYQLALSQAEARVAEAEVLVQQALADADVARKQLRNEASASDLALRKPQVFEARARLNAAHAALELAQLNLSRTQIVLPFTGRITDTTVDVGQYITPGTPLGHAFATDVVEIRLPLTDSQLASLGLPIGYIAPANQGLNVDFHATVAGQEQHWMGRLVRLDAAIDSDTRLLYGIAEVNDPYGPNVSQHEMPLAVGLYVNATIAGREVSGAYVIPREALRAGNQVYLINEGGHLDIREVEVTHSSVDNAVIASGLRQGERVIVSSIRNPIQGMVLEAMHREPNETAVLAKRYDTDLVQPDSERTGG